MCIKADAAKLVPEESACLHGFSRHGLDATHSGMNKFDGPDSANFKLVNESIKGLAAQAPSVYSRRKNGNYAPYRDCRLRHADASAERAETQPAPFAIIPFSRDRDFVNRGDILDQLRQRCSEPAGRVALVGLGGIG